LTEPSALIRGIQEEDKCSNISAIAVNILLEGRVGSASLISSTISGSAGGSKLSHRYDDFDNCDGIVLPSLSIDVIEECAAPRLASREGLRPEES
jgi:hypothetical protein